MVRQTTDNRPDLLCHTVFALTGQFSFDAVPVRFQFGSVRRRVAGVAVIVTEGFGLRGPRGWVFREVTFTAPEGGLVAIEGPSGSGRTCLLLALSGRMRPTEGLAEVAGHRLPKRAAAVRRIAALGPVAGVSELDPALTVGEHLRERVLLQRRFTDSLRELARVHRDPAGDRERGGATGPGSIAEALAAAGLELEHLVKGERTAVRDLERLEALRLGTALALLGRPKVLAVDDVDHKLSDSERAEAWTMLRSVAAGGTTVLAVCSEAPEGAIPIRATRKETATDAYADAGGV
jgi:ABC-type multidrug transport system ATPase subunit